jgi:hypothetical protein
MYGLYYVLGLMSMALLLFPTLLVVTLMHWAPREADAEDKALEELRRQFSMKAHPTSRGPAG